MICPFKWIEVAKVRAPQVDGVTDWIDGTESPVRVGLYERHFTDSPNIGASSWQYWDGKQWLIRGTNTPHWRQVGDYPCWRGLTEEHAQMQVQAKGNNP